MISLTSPVETWAHRIDAGVKLAALSAVTACFFALTSPVHLALVLVGVAAVILTGGLSFARVVLGNLKILLPFLAFIAVWHGYSGEIAEGIAVSLRLLSTLALANFVTMTTRLSDMMEVVAYLSSPLRRAGLATGALELSMALAIRFAPSISQRGTLLIEAWRARALHRPRWHIVSPLASLVLDDADHVAEALRARGGLEATPSQR